MQSLFQAECSALSNEAEPALDTFARAPDSHRADFYAGSFLVHDPSGLQSSREPPTGPSALMHWHMKAEDAQLEDESSTQSDPQSDITNPWAALS